MSDSNEESMNLKEIVEALNGEPGIVLIYLPLYAVKGERTERLKTIAYIEPTKEILDSLKKVEAMGQPIVKWCPDKPNEKARKLMAVHPNEAVKNWKGNLWYLKEITDVGELHSKEENPLYG